MKTKHSYDNSARAIKKATDGKGLGGLIRPSTLPAKKAVEPTKLVVVPPLQATSRISNDTILAIAKDRATGSTYPELSKKYAISEAYIQDALKILFLKGKQGGQVLEGLLMENAVGAGMLVKEKMSDLTPMQAAVVVGIMTKNFIDLQKHNNSNHHNEVNLNEIGEIAATLSQLNSLVMDAESE